jgi:hypothetical protein
MNFNEYYFNEDIDDSHPPVKDFKRMFMSWDESIRNSFIKAINAWHGTTMYDNNPELLKNFANNYPKEMKEYQDWIKSLATKDYYDLYRGFAGDFANNIAEEIWDAIKNKKEFVEIKLNEYTPWSTNQDVARNFSDAVIIKHRWGLDNIFHADAGRGALRKLNFPIGLSRTEREIVIKHNGSIKVDPVKDVILRGKFRARQLKLQKKELANKIKDFENRLEIGKKYLPKRNIELPVYWEDILEKGGLLYMGKEEGGLRFKYPDGSEHVIGSNNLEWLTTYLEF